MNETQVDMEFIYKALSYLIVTLSPAITEWTKRFKSLKPSSTFINVATTLILYTLAWWAFTDGNKTTLIEMLKVGGLGGGTMSLGVHAWHRIRDARDKKNSGVDPTGIEIRQALAVVEALRGRLAAIEDAPSPDSPAPESRPA